MRGVVYSYIEGLQWVLYYYYRGVASWEWFFPYHYAPRSTGIIVERLIENSTNSRLIDLIQIDSFKIKFDVGTPFKPFDQLMGVLPAASGIHIPEAFRVSFLLIYYVFLT